MPVSQSNTTHHYEYLQGQIRTAVPDLRDFEFKPGDRDLIRLKRTNAKLLSLPPKELVFKSTHMVYETISAFANLDAKLGKNNSAIFFFEALSDYMDSSEAKRKEIGWNIKDPEAVEEALDRLDSLDFFKPVIHTKNSLFWARRFCADKTAVKILDYLMGRHFGLSHKGALAKLKGDKAAEMIVNAPKATGGEENSKEN